MTPSTLAPLSFQITTTEQLMVIYGWTTLKSQQRQPNCLIRQPNFQIRTPKKFCGRFFSFVHFICPLDQNVIFHQ